MVARCSGNSLLASCEWTARTNVVPAIGMQANHYVSARSSVTRHWIDFQSLRCQSRILTEELPDSGAELESPFAGPTAFEQCAVALRPAPVSGPIVALVKVCSPFVGCWCWRREPPHSIHSEPRVFVAEAIAIR